MKFSLSHKKKKLLKKKNHFQIDPRQYWVVLLSLFVLALAGELVYFSILFQKETKKLDAPVTPFLQTNATQIRSMQKNLDTIDAALRGRVGSFVSQEPVLIEEN